MRLSKKNKIRLFALMIIIGVVGYYGYQKLYAAPPTITEQATVFSGSTVEFSEQRANHEAEWNNTIVELTGTITDKTAEGFILDDTYFFQLNTPEDATKITLKKNIKVKARFIGYDELLEESKFDQAIILH